MQPVPPGPKPYFLIGNIPLASRDPLALFSRWAKTLSRIQAPCPGAHHTRIACVNTGWCRESPRILLQPRLIYQGQPETCVSRCCGGIGVMSTMSCSGKTSNAVFFHSRLKRNPRWLSARSKSCPAPAVRSRSAFLILASGISAQSATQQAPKTTRRNRSGCSATIPKADSPT